MEGGVNMEWIVENQNDVNGARNACYYSDCATYTGCWNCPKNKGFCAIKSGGPSCTSRNCGIYVS